MSSRQARKERRLGGPSVPAPLREPYRGWRFRKELTEDFYRRFRLGEWSTLAGSSDDGMGGSVLSSRLYALWIFSKMPTSLLSADYWVEMFRAAGPIQDFGLPLSTQHLATFFAQDSCLLFRGASVGSGGVGMSWTLNAKVAEFYAHRAAGVWGAESRVFQTMVRPEDVLALFVGGDPARDHAVVLDPAGLAGRVEIRHQA